ncbi:MAG: Fur family transcriptional regulator [Bacillota bacterium]|jgi:Fur family ferric uptake transcriptional regulator
MTINRDVDQIRDKLEEKGYRLTPQRQAVLETFLANPDRHLSADDVYSIVKATNPEMGVATVYRTLELFRELHIISEQDFGQGMSRYECACDDSHHHHIVCLKCGRVWEFNNATLERVERQLAKDYDFDVVGHNMQLFGYCKNCRQKEDEPGH